jgi:hypothetical protein
MSLFRRLVVARWGIPIAGLGIDFYTGLVGADVVEGVRGGD